MRRERIRVKVLGIPLDRVGYEEALRRIDVLLETAGSKSIVTPNAEIIMRAQEDVQLKAALEDADLSFPDGIGVVIASRILGNPLRTRTAGYDLMTELLKMSNRSANSLYLLGGKDGVAELAAVNIKVKYPRISIVGTHHGYFDEDEEPHIVDKINATSPAILLVALGAPKQEVFMHRHKDKLKCGVMMGVGGSFDVLSGKVRRAPVSLQKMGLEWLYRLLADPSRLGRTATLPVFLCKVIGARLQSASRR